MADSLYPVFEIPSLVAEDDEAERVFKPAPLFDFDTGDFVRDGANRVVMVDGRDAYIIWVLKALKTQQGACLAYMDAGIDYEDAMSETPREAVQAAFERTITEALMRHPCTERVFDFEFEWDSDSLYMAFTVKPKAWAAFDVGMNVVD
jgi:hypothetical protein